MVDLINTLKDSIQLEQEIHHFKRDLALKTTEIQVIDEHQQSAFEAYHIENNSRPLR